MKCYPKSFHLLAEKSLVILQWNAYPFCGTQASLFRISHLPNKFIGHLQSCTDTNKHKTVPYSFMNNQFWMAHSLTACTVNNTTRLILHNTTSPPVNSRHKHTPHCKWSLSSVVPFHKPSKRNGATLYSACLRLAIFLSGHQKSQQASHGTS